MNRLKRTRINHAESSGSRAATAALAQGRVATRLAAPMARRVAVIVGLMPALAFAGAALTSDELAAVRQAERQRIATIERVYDTVVAIYGENPAQGGGSGVVFDPAGFVLTNFHVVQAAGKAGWAGLADGKLHRWRLIGIDPGGDLAVIQLRGKDAFAHAPLGESADVRVGDMVMAMGNPFALAEDQTPTVTLGIVSGVNRFQQGAGSRQDMLVYGKSIQVDSSINPGNSGGPLFDMRGRVIGINGRGSFEERGRVNVGLGYAISSEQIKNFIGDLLATRVAQHATLDAVFEDRGGQVVCTAIDYDHCPLVEHGFDLGARLIAFNGRPIESANAFLNELLTLPADWPVRVEWAYEGRVRQATVRLNALPYADAPKPEARLKLPIPMPGRQPDEEQPKRPGFAPIRVDLPEGVPGQIQNATINREAAELLLRRWQPTGHAVSEQLAEVIDQLPSLGQLRLEGGARLGGSVHDPRGYIVTGRLPDDRMFRVALVPADPDAPLMDLRARVPDVEPSASAASVVDGSDDIALTPFGRAAEIARARTVKIYGAGIGREEGYATGTIVSPEGRILTAQGVYLASPRLRIVLPDGSLHFGEVLRRHDGLQVAMLKIDAPTPDYFDVTEDDPAKVGDWVVAVSNAFKVADGSEPLSANLGIVSLRAELETKKRAADFDIEGEMLLIDAITSNPGAGGGALVSADGRFVGLIGKLLEAEATNTRLNYAIPADLLAAFVEGRTVTADNGEQQTAPQGEPELGIRVFAMAGRRAPAYIDRVLPDSPAAAADLRKDDLILAIDDQWVRNVREYNAAVRELKPGRRIVLSIKRDREIITVMLTVGVAE